MSTLWRSLERLLLLINAIPYYQQFFGIKTAGSSTGIVFATYNIGSIVVPFAGPANDGLDRKVGPWVGCVLVIIGTCIQAPWLRSRICQLLFSPT